MDDKSTAQNDHSTIERRLRLLARIAAVGTVAFAFISSVFGRVIYRANARFAWLLPYVGSAAVVLVVGTLIYLHYRMKRDSEVKIERSALRRMLILTALLVLFCTTLAEYLIVDPIERIHFFKYGLLCLFVFFSQGSGSIARRLCKAAFIASFVGISEESLQSFVPERVSEARDMLLNCTGALFGAAFSWLTIEWQYVMTGSRTADSTNGGST